MNSKIYSLLARFSEPSSWGGIAGLFVAFGTPIGQANAIVQLGLALCSAAAIFLPEQSGLPRADNVIKTLAAIDAVNAVKVAAENPALKNETPVKSITYPVN